VIELRRATADDVDWLVELYDDPDVEPFLGGNRARGADAIREAVERSLAEPQRFGRMVVLADGERAGALGYHEVSEVHRIVYGEALAIHPAFRGRRIADEAARLLQRYALVELGYHRLELAVYGFNERAIAHAERAGYVREGVKRKAYLRHGEWQDAVLYSLLQEELESP
jgi:RimJ/RimL family protein N-acetyltransferase